MSEVSKRMQDVFIKSSIRSDRIHTAVRIILIMIISYAYYFDEKWMFEVIVISVVLILFIPNGSKNEFFNHLLEYNTISLEDRILLNAQETNTTFDKLFSKVEELELEVEYLKSQLDEDDG